MELLELGKNPIEGESPAGIDAKYEPEYEELQEEMSKLTSPSASGGLNWKRVQELCETIIGQKSKDMMVASYLAVALLHNRGIEGMADGLVIYKDMVQTFWEDLFPPKKRMRGRKNAAEWMYQQIEAYLKDKELKPLKKELFDKINDGFSGIDSYLGENMEDPPYGRTLVEAINMIPVEAPPPEAPAAGEQATAGGEGAAPRPAPAPSAAATAAEVPAQIESAQDVQKTVAAGLKILRQAANFYMENDLSNPLIYTVNRMAAWMPVENLPPVSEGATRIPPPADQVKQILENLYTSSDWQNLLTAAETKVVQFLFWLDLSRYSYEALGQMGGKFDGAKDAVARETRAFVKRLKGVENFSFSDGSPFADDLTKQWIVEIMSEGGGGSAGPAAGGGDALEAEVAEGFKEANNLARDKNLEGGVSLLHERLSSAASVRERIMWRVALAQVLLNAKKIKTARPHLDQLLADIEAHGLMQFDPELALRGFKVALSGYRNFKDEESVKKGDLALESIARLDPGEALKFE